MKCETCDGKGNLEGRYFCYICNGKGTVCDECGEPSGVVKHKCDECLNEEYEDLED